MARAAKKQKRNTDSSKFKDAVEASSKLDGVVHEDGGPVYVEPLSEGERAKAGEELAEKLAELAKAEQDARDDAAKARRDLKKRREAIAKLRDEVREGVRKRPAQQSLPGTAA
jgi:hypothetical protein